MDDLALHTEVFNSKEVPDVICVKLPDSMPRDMDLSGIYDLTNNKELEFSDYVSRDEHRPWIDISTALLDVLSGQHIYKLTFSKEACKLTATCWFSYIIQDTFVNKPYVYMKREEEELDT